MIVEMINSVGGQPVRVPATQIVIRNDRGTPICVAAEFGPNGAQKVAHVGDPDFQRTLAGIGIADHEIDAIELKPSEVPGGASLAGGPSILPARG